MENMGIILQTSNLIQASTSFYTALEKIKLYIGLEEICFICRRGLLHKTTWFNSEGLLGFEYIPEQRIWEDIELCFFV